MAKDDFFKQEEQVPEPEQQVEEPSKIKLGEQEYSQEELNKLVNLGKTAEQYEKQYNTKFDNAWRSYGKVTQELKDTKSQLEQIQSKIQANQSQDLTPEQVEVAKKQLNNLIGGEPITDKNFAKLYLAMREGEKLIEECSTLEGDISGDDGRPKFVKEEILNYMSETGIRKPLAAYKDKYESELKAWETNQIQSAKGTGMFTQSQPTGEKQPAQVKIRTQDDLAKALTESLYGPQE